MAQSTAKKPHPNIYELYVPREMLNHRGASLREQHMQPFLHSRQALRLHRTGLCFTLEWSLSFMSIIHAGPLHEVNSASLHKLLFLLSVHEQSALSAMVCSSWLAATYCKLCCSWLNSSACEFNLHEIFKCAHVKGYCQNPVSAWKRSGAKTTQVEAHMGICNICKPHPSNQASNQAAKQITKQTSNQANIHMHIAATLV